MSTMTYQTLLSPCYTYSAATSAYSAKKADALTQTASTGQYDNSFAVTLAPGVVCSFIATGDFDVVWPSAFTYYQTSWYVDSTG